MLELQDAAERLTTAPVAFAATRDLLVVTGADAASYLQGQLSQDVEGLAVGATTRTLLLQPQGKVDTWLRVHRPTTEAFWLDTDPGHGAGAEARLNRFKLRVEVDIEVRSIPMVSVRGAGASAAVASADLGDIVALDAAWGGIEGVDLVAPDGALDPAAVVAALALDQGPDGLGEVVRVIQGLPAMGHELDEGTIPAAAGIVDPSVDFTKGCYVGQELVARVDSRGSNTPTRLHKLRFPDGEAPTAGADLVADDGAVVGTVTSAVAVPGGDAVGLGYVKRSVEAPVTLAVGLAEGRSAPVEVRSLD